MKTAELVRIIDALAPFALAEEWDNVGLLVGDEEAEVTGIALCVDATDAVIEKAIRENCSVILSHHPLMFGGVKRLCEDAFEARLATGSRVPTTPVSCMPTMSPCRPTVPPAPTPTP